MKSRILNILIGTLLVSLAASHADVVFQEHFYNPSADTNLSSIAWRANVGTTAVSRDTNMGATAGPIISINDHIFYLPNTVIPFLAWTENTAVGNIGDIGSVTKVQFVLGTQNTNEAIKVAIKVNDAWYVSQTVFNGNGSNTLTQINDLAVQAETWNSLDFVSGIVLAEGGGAVLPASGAVQAIGFFDAASTSGNRVRIDTVRVEAAPEVALLAFEETFLNPTADAPLTNINWNAVVTTAGTVYTGSTGGDGPILSVADYMYTTAGTLGGGPWLAWTDKTEVNTIGAIGNVANMSMWLRNSSSSEDLKFAIKVDGNWYVSQVVFSSGAVDEATTVSLNVQTAGWNSLNFVSGSSLVEEASASLPSAGTVTAVGVFDASASSSKVRVDTFRVYINTASSASLYAAWNTVYNLTGLDAELTADPDTDKMNNLVEYALGGNPTNADASAVLPVSSLVDANGTNGLEYVYHRRLDATARGLTYEVVRQDDLVLGSWTNSGITEAGTVVLDAEFEAVTNRIPTEVEAKQFMKLNIGFE